MSGEDWIKALGRLDLEGKTDLPITFQGGEPTIHKSFYEIVNGVRKDIPIDLLTNLEIDAKEFATHIPPQRLSRKAPYANIRVSYHHGQSNFDELTAKVLYLKGKGYSIGIWEVLHPDYEQDVFARANKAMARGIDYRVKEFLGPWKGQDHGTMRYGDAVNGPYLRQCLCKTSELLIDPAGSIFRCHSDLYANRLPIGHILDEELPALGQWRSCSVYGKCNSCDIKVKNNRFQQFGHSSVEIKEIISFPIRKVEPVTLVVNTYGKQDAPTPSV